ncbi:MAG: hypothetical protein ACO3QC_15185, partial [Phycisphaerales bacterium]
MLSPAQLRSALSSVLVTLAAALPAQGQTVVSRWNFNANGSSVGSTSASTGSGTASVVPASGMTSAVINGSNSTQSGLDPATGNGDDYYAITAFASGGANGSMGFSFSASTVGYSQIQVSWDQFADATASKYARFEYSIDGTNFITTGLANGGVFTTTTGGAWTGSRSVDLTNIAGVRNNADFKFRIVSVFQSTATGSGSAAYVAVSGTYSASAAWRI